MGTGILSAIPDFMSMISGAELADQGGSIAVQGANLTAQAALQGSNYSASVYQAYATSALADSNYNQALQQSQFDRQMDSLSRNISNVTTHNQAVQGASGLGMGSKSFLAVNNQFISNTERQIVQMRNTNLQTQQQIATQGQVQAQMFTNEANAATYSGQVQATEANYQGSIAGYKADLQESQNLTKGVSTLFSSISSS